MDRRRRNRAALVWGAAAALSLLVAGAARAETIVSFYSGKSFTSDSDLRVRQPAQGRDLRFEGVSFADESFEPPIYYGIRVTHFLKSKPWLGASLDFYHYKVFAQTDRTLRAVGTDGGAPVDRRQRLDATVQRFSISHGVNYLTLNVLGRLRWKRNARFPDGRLQPYAGIGAGGLLLHPESSIAGASFQHYEWNGLGYQLFLGAHYSLDTRWALFAEYKYNRRHINVEVAGGSTETRLNTHHIAFGTSYRL